MLHYHGKNHFSAEYCGIIFITMGAFGGGAIIVCWILMNLRGHAERGIGSAWTIGFGNAGGIVAVFLFLSKDAPDYTMGYWVLIGMVLVGVLSTFGYGALIWREKRQALANGEIEKANLLSL